MTCEIFSSLHRGYLYAQTGIKLGWGIFIKYYIRFIEKKRRV